MAITDTVLDDRVVKDTEEYVLEAFAQNPEGTADFYFDASSLLEHDTSPAFWGEFPFPNLETDGQFCAVWRLNKTDALTIALYVEKWGVYAEEHYDESPDCFLVLLNGNDFQIISVDSQSVDFSTNEEEDLYHYAVGFGSMKTFWGSSEIQERLKHLKIEQ